MAARDACTNIFDMLRNIFLLSEQIIFGNLHTRNIWLLLDSKPTEAGEAGWGEAGDGGGVGREVGEVGLLEAAERCDVLRIQRIKRLKDTYINLIRINRLL